MSIYKTKISYLCNQWIDDKRSHDTCRNIKQSEYFLFPTIIKWILRSDDVMMLYSINLINTYYFVESFYICFAICYYITTSCLWSFQSSYFQLTNQRRIYFLKQGTYTLRNVVWLVNINLIFYMIIWSNMIESLLDITPIEMLLNDGVWSNKNQRYNKHMILIIVALCQHEYFCKWGLPRDAY